MHVLTHWRFLLIPTLLFIIVACSESVSPPDDPDPDPEPPIISDTLEAYRTIFVDPAECAACHPNHYEQWSESMHAYAAVDPVFHALNEIVQSEGKVELDQFCTKCHTPFGSILGETPPGFSLGDLSDIARAGVHCDVCHSVDQAERGLSVQSFRLDRVRKGPIIDPVENPFHGD